MISSKNIEKIQCVKQKTNKYETKNQIAQVFVRQIFAFIQAPSIAAMFILNSLSNVRVNRLQFQAKKCLPYYRREAKPQITKYLDSSLLNNSILIKFSQEELPFENRLLICSYFIQLARNQFVINLVNFYNFDLISRMNFLQILDELHNLNYFILQKFRMQSQHRFIEKILQLITIAGVTFISYTLLGLYGLIAIVVSFTSLSILLYLKWRTLRQKGLIAFMKQKLRATLLQRSILDIFRDIVYFPYVTKIIGAAVNIATTKPHPDRIPQILKTLPSQVCQIATKKGLLSLAPSAVQSLILPQINKELIPAHYGHNQSQWDRIQEYQRGEQLVHEQTLEKRIVVFLDGKFGWLSVLVMLGTVLAGAHHMNPKKFKRMIIQNSTFCCLLLSMIALIIKVRRHYHKNKRNNPKAIQAIIQE